MKFGPIPVAQAKGAILAHSVGTGKFRLRKGLLLDSEAVSQLQNAGIEHVLVGQPETGDVLEDAAAVLLCEALVPEFTTLGLAMKAPFTGRVNLFAKRPGLLRVNAQMVNAVNRVDPDITLATLPDYTRVATGDMLATVKIIPYAVRGETVAAAIDAVTAPTLQILPFRLKTAALILTKTDAISGKILTKGRDVTARRLDAMGVRLISVETVPHEARAVSAALTKAEADLTLILGASATSDRRDVCPAGLVDAGGQITRFGMPVDPGNLLFLGRLKDTPVIGLPGCARSPAINGADWVLERVICGLEVSGDDIAGMGVGGLLKEIPTRPQPRAYDTRKSGGKRIEVIILAAGSSSRMQGEDKLLKLVNGVPLLGQSVEAAMQSRADRVRVVLPVGSNDRRRVLEGLDVSIVEAKDAADGMAGSLKNGLAALASGTDAVIVALADMPEITSTHYDALIENFNPEQGREICRAVTENGRKGHPVLFGARFFESLAALTGDQGAREIVATSQEFVTDVPTKGQGAVIDLDTPQAWDAYQKDQLNS